MPVSLVTSPFVASADLSRALAAVRPHLECALVSLALELDLHHRIRHEVFVGEQALFRDTDYDAHDEDPSSLHVIGLSDGVVAGTVRLYPLDSAGSWKGDRLAVLPPFRAHGLGAPLVHFAVRTAGELGGRVMHAHIQLANVRFFERLGWRCVGEPEEYVGVQHQRMEIELDGHR